MIHLREGEEVVFTTEAHWSGYCLPAAWGGLGVLVLIGEIAFLFKLREGTLGLGLSLLLACIFFGPLAYKYLQNHCRAYIITNRRLYVENGILAKTKRDIPLPKINDVEMSQGIFQRLVDAGDVLILTGNDTSTLLKNIDRPDAFRSQLTELVGRASLGKGAGIG